MAELLASARALVVTAAEEFGIAAVEALASGRPVIALGAGGVMESVRAGETGAYYERDDPDELARVVEAFDPLGVDPQACVAAAQRFGTDRFQAQLRAIVAPGGRGGARSAARRSADRGHRPAVARRAAVRVKPPFTFGMQDSSGRPKTSVQLGTNCVTLWAS